MRLFVITLYLLLIIHPSMSQQVLSGNVMNDQGQGIAFATVIGDANNATICDSMGYFEIARSDAYDELTIAALGYQTANVGISPHVYNYQLILNPTSYALDEFSVDTYQDISYKSSVSAFSTDKKEIKALSPRHVNEVLENKMGFTSRSTYQAPITLRGMSGKRLLILRNGMRRFSSYPAGFMTHTINVYDLERIEVEKGASSVIYGAGAMAGIINLIDKSPFKQNGLNAKVSGGYGAINNERNFLTCGGWSDGKLAVKAGLRLRKADNFKYPDGSEAENSFYEDKDLFITGGYQFSKQQNLTFSADMHDGGPWGKPVGFNGSNYMRVLTNDEISNNYSLKYNYRTSDWLQNLTMDVYYSNENRELVKNYYTAAGYQLSYVETTSFSDYYYGSLVKAKMKVNDKHTITSGAEGFSFHISTPTDAIDYVEVIAFQNRVSKDARSYAAAVFLEDKMVLTPTVNLSAGLRYNYASVYEGDVFARSQDMEQQSAKHALSGNVATAIRIKDNSKLKLNVARSFRMPETTELYTDNYTSNGIIYGNSILKPEYCNSVDLAYSYRHDFLQFELSPFLWLMNDMISKEEIAGMPGTNYTYVNIGKTRMYGGEANVDFNFDNLLSGSDNLHWQIGLAYLNGTDVTDESSYWDSGVPLDYVPPLNLKSNIKYRYDFKDVCVINAAVRSIYYTEQKRLGESPYATPAYLIFGVNLGLSWPSALGSPSINMAINNLTNKEYYTYQSYLPSEGRDIRLFLTLQF